MFDALFSTQGIMVLLLAAYAGAMWTFLSNAPKVYTIMVSDLEIAKQFYEGMLNLSAADIPLHYYYNYDQSLGGGAMDPMYMAGNPGRIGPTPGADGLWYQLRKNAQLHIVTGANIGERGRQRHISFDRDGLEEVLMRVQTRGLKYKIQQERPLDFLVKDYDGRTLELCEMHN
ncbi:MAG: glyoxalase-like domain protein [Alkalinema sp. RL_2_19]|nr:glyoxalase-like domain protein [Alkalinema sp. RL_2_19]